ncbi:MAG TPA: hypothetical protein VNG51_15865 [Ktedonobacteraceae bacterium]|nr:hypothetical protein [Ktedonobacteraceae bacterium]
MLRDCLPLFPTPPCGIGSDLQTTWQHRPAQATPGVVSIPREQWRAFFYGKTTLPQALIAADEAGAPAISPELLALLLPGTVEDAARRSTCPLSLGFGASALSACPRSDPHADASVPSIITLSVQPGASQCASFAPNRFDLWTGLAAWCRATAGAAVGYRSSGLFGWPRLAWSACPPTPAAVAPEEEEKS